MATTTTTTQDAFPISSSSSSSSLSLASTDSSATAAGQEEGPTRARRSPRARSSGEEGADAATVNNGGRAPRKLRPRGNVCMQCREQKVLCCGGAPCERCFRMALPCRPQDYRYALQDPQTNDATQRRQWLRRKRGYCRRRPGKAADENAGWEPVLDNGSPLLSLAFQRGSPRAHAEVACEVFMSLLGSGTVLRPKALAFLRAQASMAEVCGADPTHGLLPLVSQTQGAAALELETLGSLCWARPPQARTGLTAARTAWMEERRAAIRRERWWKDLDDGSGAAVYCAASEVDPQGSPLIVVASNAAADEGFKAAGAVFSDVLGHKTVAYLLFCNLIAPEDRRAFLACVFRLLFTQTTEKQTELVKIFDAEGEVRLFLLEAFLRPRQNAPPAFVLRLQRVPASRHLTLRPEYRTTLQSLARVPEPEAAAAVDAADDAPAVPSIPDLVPALRAAAAATLPPPFGTAGKGQGGQQEQWHPLVGLNGAGGGPPIPIPGLAAVVVPSPLIHGESLAPSDEEEEEEGEEEEMVAVPPPPSPPPPPRAAPSPTTAYWASGGREGVSSLSSSPPGLGLVAPPFVDLAMLEAVFAEEQEGGGMVVGL